MTSVAALIEPGAPAEPVLDKAARLERRRRQRLGMLAMAFASYAVDTALLIAIAATGALDAAVPWAYAAAGMTVCGAFYGLLSSGWSERLEDHYLAMPQMVVSALINLGFIAWVPQIGVLLMMVLFIIFAFGSLRMNVRRVLIGAVLLSFAVAALIAFAGDRLSLPMATWQQRLVCGLWFALILARTTLLGLYGSQVREELAKRNAQLATTFAKLDKLASQDELTGTLNRRSIMRLLEEERERTRRSSQAFGVAMLDIDHFKEVNDRFGHLVGDQVLCRFAQTVTQGMRSTDRLGRFGGEEFLLLLTATEGVDAIASAAERVRSSVANFRWAEIAPGLSLTVSAGVSMCGRDDTTEQLLDRADRALYLAKREGRNCVRLGLAD
ncbi:MAG: GGDEF domain-containing protein [Burkholderiales bacterium]